MWIEAQTHRQGTRWPTFIALLHMHAQWIITCMLMMSLIVFHYLVVNLNTKISDNDDHSGGLSLIIQTLPWHDRFLIVQKVVLTHYCAYDYEHVHAKGIQLFLCICHHLHCFNTPSSQYQTGESLVGSKQGSIKKSSQDKENLWLLGSHFQCGGWLLEFARLLRISLNML